MDKVKLITEIVSLVKGSGLFAQESYADTIAHYNHAYERPGMLYYIEEDGKLLGFVDGFKLPSEPGSYEEAIAMFKKNPKNEGPIGVLVNMVIPGNDKRITLRLMQMCKDQNPEWKVILWLNFKTGKFRRFTNARREPCRETAE